MARALIIYGSTSGNTAHLSTFVEAGLLRAGYEVVRRDAKVAKMEELAEYDLLVFGSSSWDGPKKEGLVGKDQNKNVQGNLQIDMRNFVGGLDGYDFQQRPVAIFAVGHYSYTFTCHSGDILEEFVRIHNGRLVGGTFKVSDVVDLYDDAIEQWASELKG